MIFCLMFGVEGQALMEAGCNPGKVRVLMQLDHLLALGLLDWEGFRW